ncbi:MAG: adenosylcobinamide-GDP ribazoletransferase [Gaiellaceae bacterium]
MPGGSVRAAAAALAFLTRVPVGRLAALGPDDVARGAVLFPVVGAGIGALVGGIAVGLDSRLTVLLAAALAVAVEALVTGAIHLDGLADTADGLGAPTREQALEVMREPAIGSFGATALGLDLLVKTAALAALLDGPDPVPAAVAAFALGRAAPLALSWALPYARAGGGTGASLADGARAPWLAAGLLLGIGVAVGVLGLRGLWLAAGAAVAALAVALVARQRLGGVTGDVLGAAVELATTLALVAAVATR